MYKWAQNPKEKRLCLKNQSVFKPVLYQKSIKTILNIAPFHCQCIKPSGGEIYGGLYRVIYMMCFGKSSFVVLRAKKIR